MIDFITYEQIPVLSPVGETNTYLIIDESKHNIHVIIIDPAGEAEKISERIDSLDAVPMAILLTHAHFDHIAAADILKTMYDIPIYCGAADRDLLEFSLSLLNSPGHKITVTVDNWLRDDEYLQFGNIKLKVINTPGHSKGSLCYYISSAELLISGDTIFLESIGRTDFPYKEMQGSYPELLSSLKKIFSEIPDNVKVLPGHGSVTTIKHERLFQGY